MLGKNLEFEFRQYKANFLSGTWISKEFGVAVVCPAIVLFAILLIENAVKPYILPESGLTFLVYLPIWLSVKLGNRTTGLITAFLSAIALNASAIGDVPPQAFFINFILLTAVCQGLYSVEKRISESAKQAITDPLTGLLTRNGFSKQVANSLSIHRLNQTSACIVLFDCDKFKEINDQYGHKVGDQALKTVAKALKRAANPDDLVARLGGDEFVVFLQESDSIGANIFLSRARSLALEFGKDLPLPIRLSAGIAHFPEESTNLEALIDIADNRMFRNKKESKGSIDLYAVIETPITVRKPSKSKAQGA